MSLHIYLSDQTERLLKRLKAADEWSDKAIAEQFKREHILEALQRVAEQVAADVEIKGDEAATVKNVKLNNR